MVFVTTTVLDFVPAFARDELKTLFIHMLVDEHQQTGAALHAFVLMPQHAHFFTTLPTNLTSSAFVKELKHKTSLAIQPHLHPKTLRAFDAQRGLNRRVFWQRSFRGIRVLGERMFRVFVDYIHNNPVKAGLCDRPEEYPWSSAHLFLQGVWSP